MIKVCAKLNVFTVQLTDRYYIYQFINSLEHALKYSGHINLGFFHVLYIIEPAGPLSIIIFSV